MGGEGPRQFELSTPRPARCGPGGFRGRSLGKGNALHVCFCVSWELSQMGMTSKNQQCSLTGLFWDEAGKFSTFSK